MVLFVVRNLPHRVFSSKIMKLNFSIPCDRKFSLTVAENML